MKNGSYNLSVQDKHVTAPAEEYINYSLGELLKHNFCMDTTA